MYPVLEANWGHWQMPIAENEREKTTFAIHRGAFGLIGMTFGLRSAPATIKCSLDLIISEVHLKKFLVYLEYVLIFSRKLKDHINHSD